MKPFLEQLTKKILVCDGAMGTMLIGAQKPESALEYLNITEPWKVMKVHTAYAEAGANIIETNTFGANDVTLAKFGLSDKVEAINKAGATIARQSISGKEIYVAGAVGPANHNGSEDTYKRQISALAEAGVDLIIIETMANPESTLNAIKAAKKTSNLPVVAQIACYKDFMTKSNIDAETFFRILDDSEADVLGINCLIDPKEMYPILEQIRKWTKKPLSIQPNAGEVTFSEQELYVGNDVFQRYTKKFIAQGARIIGGCCGTTPTQISTIAKVVKENQKPLHIEIIEKKPERIIISSSLEQMLATKTIFPIVELDPPLIGKSANTALLSAIELNNAGIKVFTIADNPGATPRIDSLAFASLLLRQIPSAEIILHMACRDLSTITAESRISGAEALGIHNILAITGDRPANGDYDKSIAVNNFQSISLIRLLSKRNQGENALSEQIEPSNLYIGCAFDCGRFPSEKLRNKTKYFAGSNFALTQIISDKNTIQMLAEFTEDSKKNVWTKKPFYIIPGVYLFRSYANMQAMQNPPFRIKISPDLLEKMQDCKTIKEQKECGYQIARETILEAKKYFPAVYVIPPAKKPEAIIPLLKETGLA